VRGSSASRIRDLIERVAGDDSGGCRGGLAPKVARLIAGLVRIVRDVGLAEDLAQDALVAALTQWREIGDPDHPGAWPSRAPAGRLSLNAVGTVPFGAATRPTWQIDNLAQAPRQNLRISDRCGLALLSR
jgi:hypothetical protein